MVAESTSPSSQTNAVLFRNLLVVSSSVFFCFLPQFADDGAVFEIPSLSFLHPMIFELMPREQQRRSVGATSAEFLDSERNIQPNP